MKGVTRKIWDLLPAAALMLLFLVIWQAYVELADVNSVILPPPTEVATALWENRSLLLSDLGVTIREIVYGFLLGAGVGMFLGILIVYSKAMERALYPLVITSQAVPVFAIAPLLVIWFGFGITPKILMAAVIVFFPICVNQVEGLRSADRGAIELMSAFGASEWKVFRTVRLPASVPYLLAGMQLGVTYAVIGAVIAEWLGADSGIGYRMVVANSLAQTDIVFAAIVVAAVVGVVLFAVVRIVGNLLFPWQARRRRES
jgi:ABC-type nitrate/sulfonate/bicarbonate transport system permease component